MIVVYIILYLLVGALFALVYCIIMDIPPSTNMPEENKNMLIIIDAFWPFIIPFAFIRRLYKAIKFFVNKNKIKK